MKINTTAACIQSYSKNFFDTITSIRLLIFLLVWITCVYARTIVHCAHTHAGASVFATQKWFYINVKNNMMRWNEWRYKHTNVNVLTHTRVIWDDMSKMILNEWDKQKSKKKLSQPFGSSSKCVSEYEGLKRQNMPRLTHTFLFFWIAFLSYHLVNDFLSRISCQRPLPPTI